MFCLEV
jgi:hypothetical protein